jgi:hypothetical protein
VKMGPQHKCSTVVSSAVAAVAAVLRALHCLQNQVLALKQSITIDVVAAFLVDTILCSSELRHDRRFDPARAHRLLLGSTAADFVSSAGFLLLLDAGRWCYVW